MLIRDGKITIQIAEYIEFGWYIEVIDEEITLYDIPFHVGKVQKIGSYKTILDAINSAKELA